MVFISLCRFGLFIICLLPAFKFLNAFSFNLIDFATLHFDLYSSNKSQNLAYKICVAGADKNIENSIIRLNVSF